MGSRKGPMTRNLSGGARDFSKVVSGDETIGSRLKIKGSGEGFKVKYPAAEKSITSQQAVEA